MNGSCPRSMRLALVAALCGALVGPACSSFARDLEHTLRPSRERVVDTPELRVELVDVAVSRDTPDSLVVTLFIENRTGMQARIAPEMMQLALGDEMYSAVQEVGKPSRSRDSDPSPAPGGADELIDPGYFEEFVADILRLPTGWGRGHGTRATLAAGAVTSVLDQTAFFMGRTHDAADQWVQAERNRIPPGEWTQVAILFQGVPKDTALPASYLFFLQSVTLSDGSTVRLPPLLITNPQEPNMGFDAPSRPRFTLGMRIGGQYSLQTEAAPPFDGGLELEAFAGVRAGRWSFTPVAGATTSPGLALGFDARFDLVESTSGLLTAYAGYGRYWVENDLLGADALRLGLDLQLAGVDRAFGWDMISYGVGFYVQVVPFTFGDDDLGVKVSGGMSLMVF